MSTGEAQVLAERLPKAALARAGQDLLRGLGRAQPVPVTPHPHWPGVLQALAQCLGTTADRLPWAAWAARADSLQPEPASHWGFLATGRLHMTPQQVRLLLMPSPDDPAWLSALEAGLAEELPVRLHRGASGQIYLSSPEPIDLSALHPRLMEDRHLPEVLPTGAQARAWRKASQLACMLTHQWSAEQGYPDALWLWGVCGLAEDPPPDASPPGTDPQVSQFGAGAPLWIAGYQAAWSRRLQQPSPTIHWRPMPSQPVQGQDMIRCWGDHWAGCLEEMMAGAGPRATADQGSAALGLIASLQTQWRTWWPLHRERAPIWQMGLGQSPTLRDLPSMLAVPE